MAVLKFGAIVTKAVGKAGGHFFSYGQGGAILATNGPRVKKGASFSQTWAEQKRNTVALAQSWRGLTDNQRAAWGADSANWPTNNRVGDAMTLSGYAHYMNVNSVLASVGISAITAPAAKIALPLTVPASITTLSQTQFVVDPVNAPSGSDFYVIMATRTLSNGRVPTRRDYRIVAVKNRVDSTPYDIFSEYTNIFGAPLINGQVYVQIYLVNTNTGQKSVPLASNGLVA